MPSQHKTTPLSIRLPDAERRFVYEYAERNEIPVRQVILKAIRDMRDQQQKGSCD